MPGDQLEYMVESWSNGRLQLDVTPLLFEPAEAFYAVADGRMDMSTFGITYVSGTHPLWNYSALPFYWKDNYELERASFDPRLMEIINETITRPVGAVYLADVTGVPMDVIWGDMKVDKLEDFAGLKIRTSGVVMTSTYKVLGTSPLSIPGGELVESLRRGTVDAIGTTRSYGFSIGLTDVCEYANIWDGVGGYWGQALVCNAKSFDALPADLQEILLAASREAAFRIAYGVMCDIRWFEKIAARSHAQILYPPEKELARAKQATKAVIDEWEAMSGPHASEFRSILDEYASGAR